MVMSLSYAKTKEQVAAIGKALCLGEKEEDNNHRCNSNTEEH
jgi:hypothetical protein